MHSVLADLRWAVRSLSRTPGFAAVCVLSLALGIGAGTTVFSVVDGLLVRPLPYPDPERLISSVTWAPDGQRVVFQVQDRLQSWLDLNEAYADTGASRTFGRIS